MEKLNKNLLGYPKYGLKVAYITGIVTHVLMESFLFHTTAGVQFNPLLKIHFTLVSEAFQFKLSSLVSENS